MRSATPTCGARAHESTDAKNLEFDNPQLGLLGGMAFISSSEISYLLAASRALAFHPPSRLSMVPALDRYLAGESLVMP